MGTPPIRGGRWLIALAIVTVMLAFFWVCGVFTPPDAPPGTDGFYGPALFFSVTLAYIVPIFGYISERTTAAMSALSGCLDADAQTIDGWRRRIRVKPVRWLVVVLLIGSMSGVLHNLLLYRSVTALVESVRGSTAAAAVVVGTELIWIVFTLVVAGLLDNALVLNRAARHARVQPFNTRTLRPFATVAVISTLGLIGAQAAFPIMSVEEGLDPLAYIPGLMATAVPMVLLAALPVWPLHRRLVDCKRDMLERLDARLGAMPMPDPDRRESVEALTPLLSYRREVAQIPEWPFDVGVLTRLGMYLIIPPLTWVGAALIENLVNLFL